MSTRPPDVPAPLQPSQPAPPHLAELDRLGDQIAELSAHLEAATSRLLDLIREFDVRRGWQNGFRSCAEWLAWRVSLDLGAARERVRVARALGTLPALAEALARGELSYAKVPRPDAHCDAGNRSPAARGAARGHGGPRGEHRAGLAPPGPAG